MHKNTIETNCTVAQIITTPIPKKLECCAKCNHEQNADI